jgi:hypothetical protein
VSTCARTATYGIVYYTPPGRPPARPALGALPPPRVAGHVVQPRERRRGAHLRERRGPVDPHGTALRKARHERRLRPRLALDLLLPPARCAQTSQTALRPRKLRSNLVDAMARPAPPQAPARRNRNGATPRGPGRAGAPRASASSLHTAPGRRCRPLQETGPPQLGLASERACSAIALPSLAPGAVPSRPLDCSWARAASNALHADSSPALLDTDAPSAMLAGTSALASRCGASVGRPLSSKCCHL